MTPLASLLLIAASAAGPLVLVWARRRPGFPADALRLWVSAGMWALACGDLLALRGLAGVTRPGVGLGAPNWTDAVRGGVLGLVGLALAGSVLSISSRGPLAAESRDAIARLAAMPLWARLFTLVTVAVTEEVLFRIAPVGAADIGGVAPLLAAAVGLAAFVAAHVHWGRAHAPFVWVVGGFLTVSFLLFRDGWANVIAHALIDVPPLLFARAMLRGVSGRSTPQEGAPT